MFKKILNIMSWVIVGAGMLAMVGFAEIKRKATPCKMLDIRIIQHDSDFFITPSEIRKLIQDQQGEVIGKEMNRVSVPKMEAMMNSNPYIASAQVYATIDGSLEVRVMQKKPIVRIINSDDESYYLDSIGTLMPLSNDYTAKVLIVNGSLNEPYAMYSGKTVKQMEHDSTMHTMIPAIYKLASYISHNSFWSSQITQVYVDTAKDFCLIPRVGNQKIIFGDISDIEQKFKRLWVLYHDGLNATGRWNDYTIINLKFKHQIVCTKK